MLVTIKHYLYVCRLYVDPDVPAIGSIAVGENSANVSWSPSKRKPAANPGGRFYVEYVKVSDAGLCWLSYVQ